MSDRPRGRAAGLRRLEGKNAVKKPGEIADIDKNNPPVDVLLVVKRNYSCVVSSQSHKYTQIAEAFQRLIILPRPVSRHCVNERFASAHFADIKITPPEKIPQKINGRSNIVSLRSLKSSPFL